MKEETYLNYPSLQTSKAYLTHRCPQCGDLKNAKVQVSKAHEKLEQILPGTRLPGSE